MVEAGERLCQPLRAGRLAGPGIAAEDPPQIFERFYRGDKSRSSANGHNGLGLTICKAIVEAHDDSIEVSNRVNGGAVFRTRLPMTANASPP